MNFIRRFINNKDVMQMTNILLCGANGKMGNAVSRAAQQTEGINIVAGFDLNTKSD